METFQTVCTLSRLSGNFPDRLETFWTVFPNCPRLSTLSGNFSDCPELSKLSGNFPHCLETFQTVWKLSRLSGNFQQCLEIFQTVQNFPHCPETFHTVWKLSRLSGNFPDCLKIFQTALKLSRQSEKFPHLFTLRLMFRLHFMGNFVNTRKNFPDAQKLSGWQCQRANDVFGTLADCGVGFILRSIIKKDDLGLMDAIGALLY